MNVNHERVPPVSLQACQMIYSNVKANLSPNNRGGFQTLYASYDDLTSQELKSIGSAWLQAMKREEPVPEYLFFTISTRDPSVSPKVVIATISPTDMGKDDHNRDIFGFAHALILDQQEFTRVFQNNPFPLLRSFHWISTLKQAQKQIIPDTSILPPVTLTADPDYTPLNEEFSDLVRLPNEMLMKLLLLACQIPEPGQSGEQLWVSADSGHLTDLLDQLFYFLPLPIRLQMSFDTLFDGQEMDSKSTPKRSPFRVLGSLPDKPGSSQITSFRLTDFTMKEGRKEPVVTPTGEWILAEFHSLIPTREESTTEPRPEERLKLLKKLAVMFEFSQAVSGHPFDSDTLSDASKMEIKSFEKANPGLLNNRILSLLQEVGVGPSLQKKIFRQAKQRVLQDEGISLVDSLTDGFSVNEIIVWVKEAFLSDTTTPIGKRDVEELKAFKIHAGTPAAMRLRIIDAMVLRWQKKWNRLAELLCELSLADYEEFCRWSLDTLVPEIQFTVICDMKPKPGAPLEFSLLPRRMNTPENGEELLTALAGHVTQEQTASAEKKPRKGKQEDDILIITIAELPKVPPRQHLRLMCLILDRQYGLTQESELNLSEESDEAVLLPMETLDWNRVANVLHSALTGRPHDEQFLLQIPVEQLNQFLQKYQNLLVAKLKDELKSRFHMKEALIQRVIQSAFDWTYHQGGIGVHHLIHKGLSHKLVAQWLEAVYLNQQADLPEGTELNDLIEWVRKHMERTLEYDYFLAMLLYWKGEWSSLGELVRRFPTNLFQQFYQATSSQIAPKILDDWYFFQDEESGDLILNLIIYQDQTRGNLIEMLLAMAGYELEFSANVNPKKKQKRGMDVDSFLPYLRSTGGTRSNIALLMFSMITQHLAAPTSEHSSDKSPETEDSQ